jgi:signal transduction histidine kinase
MTQLAEIEAEIATLRARTDAQAQHREAIEHITGLLPWRIDDGEVIYSPAYRAHVGFVDGVPVEEQFTFDDFEKVAATWVKFAADAGARRLQMIVAYRAADGRRRWHHSAVVAIRRDADGQMTHGLGGSIDITDLIAPLAEARQQQMAQVEELRAVNARLAQQTAQLKQANTTLEEFAYAASHDLQAPLRAIAHFASWIEEDLPSNCGKQVRGHVRGMLGRVSRMVALHADLLAYARIAGRRPEATLVDLQQLVRSTWYHGEPPGGFEIEAHVPAGEVRVAESSIRTVLRNLFRNAITHHDRDEGRVTVTARVEPHRLWMRVEDDGPGIDPTHAKDIFKALYQIGKPADGSGMGLAIAKRHATEMHGELVHHAKGGRGAVFEIHWPLA